MLETDPGSLESAQQTGGRCICGCEWSRSASWTTIYLNSILFPKIKKGREGEKGALVQREGGREERLRWERSRLSCEGHQADGLGGSMEVRAGLVGRVQEMHTNDPEFRRRKMFLAGRPIWRGNEPSWKLSHLSPGRLRDYSIELWSIKRNAYLGYVCIR